MHRKDAGPQPALNIKPKHHLMYIIRLIMCRKDTKNNFKQARFALKYFQFINICNKTASISKLTELFPRPSANARPAPHASHPTAIRAGSILKISKKEPILTNKCYICNTTAMPRRHRARQAGHNNLTKPQ